VLYKKTESLNQIKELYILPTYGQIRNDQMDLQNGRKLGKTGQYSQGDNHCFPLETICISMMRNDLHYYQVSIG
jgi:hypothetical protein